MAMNNERMLKAARNAERLKIAINPVVVEYMEQRGYRFDSSIGYVEDGEPPVRCVGFNKPVRVFDNASVINPVEREGLTLGDIKTYVLCEWDEDLKYGQIFEYLDKKYMVLIPKTKKKFGGVISKYAELRDETEGSIYG